MSKPIPAIEVSGLTKRYGSPESGVLAVDRVSFQVHQGEVFGFLGPNGAGKTTTVRMLTGVIDPTAGTATIQRHDVRKDSLAAREHLGIVPEQANVYLDLTVWQNVMLMAELHAVPRRQRMREGRRLLDLLGLADRREHKARTLSKGLRQRLMLCSALVSGPEVMFLDEPTTGLDVHSTWYVEVRFEEPTPAAPALKSLPGVDRITRRDETYRLYTTSPGRVAVVLATLADQNGWAVVDLGTHKPSLEDVFLHLTGQSDQEVRG
jgi:ABC-type Na+ transport system ATPase subunit NatA